MRKYKFLSLFLVGIVIALNLFGITADVKASVVYESVSVNVPFTSNGGDTVTIYSDNPSYSDKITLPPSRTDSRSDKFVMTYNEPGTYKYILSNGKKSFNIEINVLSSDSAILTANTTIYDSNGEKTDSINMYENIYVQLIVDTEGNGTATGGGKYISGSKVTVKATPSKNSVFVGWRDENGNIVSTDPTYTFTLDGSKTDIYRLTAVFKPEELPPVSTGEDANANGLIGALLVVCGLAFVLRKEGANYEC